MSHLSCIRCQYCLVILLKYVFALNKYANRKKNGCYFSVYIAFHWILLLKIPLVLVQWFSTGFAKRLRLYFAESQIKSGPTQYQTCLLLYPHSKWTQINCSLGHILFTFCSFIVLRMRADCVTCWNLEMTDDYGQNTVQIDWTYNLWRQQ